MPDRENDSLTWIDGLEEFLGFAEPDAAAEQLVALIKLMEMSLAADPGYSTTEKHLLAEVKSGVKHVIEGRQTGQPPGLFLARLPLAELRKSIRARQKPRDKTGGI